MKITVVKSYDELSEVASNILLDEIKKKPDTQVCLATGSSPTGMYAKFVEQVHNQEINVDDVLWTKLDEWIGIDLENKSSCEYYIKEHILDPLQIKESSYLAFNTNAEDMNQELTRIQKALKIRPLDVCILGIGVNGHLGLNEPAMSLEAFSHIVELDEKSKSHPMLASQNVSGGITLGLSEIMHAKKIIFLVSGISKKEMFHKFMEKEISTMNPSSLLWLHPNVELIVEEDIYN